MKAQVMKKAWEIAKDGVKKFGGRVNEYLSEALRIAWQIVKGLRKEVKKMIELKGTPKQVAWAESIRKWVARMFDDAKAHTEMIPQFTDEHLKAFKEAEKIIMTKDSAKFWIETFSPHIQPRNLEGLEGRELMRELEHYSSQVSPVVANVTREQVKEKGLKTKGIRGIDLATRYYRKMRNELS